MTQISACLASGVITCIPRVGVRSVLGLALLRVAEDLSVQGHGAPWVPGSPCCAQTLDARGALLRLGLVQRRVVTAEQGCQVWAVPCPF